MSNLNCGALVGPPQMNTDNHRQEEGQRVVDSLFEFRIRVYPFQSVAVFIRLNPRKSAAN
jgi:hypothetical protein